MPGLGIRRHDLPSADERSTPMRKRSRTRRAGRGLTPRKRRVPVLLEITRDVPHHVQCMLWGKSAGRCEFAGCNEILWKSQVTQEPVNIAQKAHIYSFSSAGPRGNRGVSTKQLNDLGNL